MYYINSKIAFSWKINTLVILSQYLLLNFVFFWKFLLSRSKAYTESLKIPGELYFMTPTIFDSTLSLSSE